MARHNLSFIDRQVEEEMEAVYPKAGFITVTKVAWNGHPAKQKAIKACTVEDVEEADDRDSTWIRRSNGDRPLRVEESVAEVLHRIELCKLTAED